MKTNPLLIAGAAVAGLWLFGRARAQGAAIAGPRAGVQNYSTPTAVAANAARIIVALTKNLSTAFDRNAIGTNAMQLDVAGLSPGTNLGGWSFGNMGGVFGSQLGDPVFGWSAPNPSAVRNLSVAQYGSEVDQIPAAPVYDMTTDFVNNPPPVGFGYNKFDFGG